MILPTRPLLQTFFIFLSFLLPQSAPADEEPAPSSTGSAFVVSAEGHLVTAFHVVKGKTMVLAGPVSGKKWVPARVIKTDPENDLALLKTEHLGFGPPLPIARWEDVPIGLEVYSIGYPKPRIQGLSRKITQGIVNGDRSESGNADFFQFSAGIQKGNSGGALLAPDGSVIGVALRKLGSTSKPGTPQDLPQNVNYGLKSSRLLKFLSDSGIQFKQSVLRPEVNDRPYQIYRRCASSVVAILARSNPPVE